MTTLSSIYNSPGSGGSSADELVKISATDTTAQYLEDALVQGTGVTLTKNNSGGNETITIAASGGGSTTTVSAGANISVNQVGNDYSVSTHPAYLITDGSNSVTCSSGILFGVSGSSYGKITTTTIGIGASSLQSNNSATSTAVGHYALASNTSGLNTAFGYGALFRCTNGSNNVAVGPNALYECTTQYGNTAVGVEALKNSTGGGNTSVGYWSSYTLTTGSNNTCIGFQAGNGTTGGATSFLITGDNNLLLGYNSKPSASEISNEVTLGNSDISSLRCAVTSITSLSDIRDKADITQLPIGLDFINSLNPVTYRWDKREWYENGERDGSKKQEKLQAGFIAQELQESQAEFNADYLNLVYDSNPNKLEATPGNLLFVLVNAVKELSSKLESVEAELATLKASKKRSTKAGAQ